MSEFKATIAKQIEGEKQQIKVEEIEEDNYDSSYEIKDWDEIDMESNILRGIYAYGFEKPSPIQKKAILPIIKGRDIIAQAQSGTGKTATFSIGALSIVNLSENVSQVLVLSPTRELTDQTAKVMRELGGMMTNLRIQTLYGGSPYEESNHFQDKNAPHIICGCPGRVYDLMRKERITSKNIRLLILDEADEMLSSGFKEQVYNIFQYLNNDIQVALFSATLPNSVVPIVDKIMRNPVKICVKAEQLTLEGIAQYYIAVEDDRQKYATLKDLYKVISVSQCIIYCNSVKRVTDLYEAMKEDDFPVCRIHSSMERYERESAFQEFRNGKSRVLISSNVTARGIDIQQVSVVINFDIPKDIHTYLHRIGRSGRWGRKGVGINFITRRDITKLREIEGYYACQIQEMPSNYDISKSI
jgi:superfamily II DNA/RNA helicase